MADVCEDNNTVYRPNLLKPRTSSLSSRKSDIVRREAMNSVVPHALLVARLTVYSAKDYNTLLPGA